MGLFITFRQGSYLTAYGIGLLAEGCNEIDVPTVIWAEVAIGYVRIIWRKICKKVL